MVKHTKRGWMWAGALAGTLALDSHPVRNVVVGAPADGWDSFVDALGTAGFLAAATD